MLRVIDVRNCPSLRQPLELSGCENIERIYAQGTGITSVVLPVAGNLIELYLPETISNLTIRNQSRLTDGGLVIAGVQNLTTLILENMNNLNIFALIDRCLAVAPVVLSRVRLTGISGNFVNLAGLVGLTKMAGIDENGNNTDRAVVKGKCNVTYVYVGEYEPIAEAFPELKISYTYYCIRFDDPVVKAICISKWDKNRNGEVDAVEALAVEEIVAEIFQGNKDIVSFNELKYFKNVTFPHDGAFQNCTSLESICFPDGDGYRLRAGILKGCTSLEYAEIPDSYTLLKGEMFSGCTSLKRIKLPSELQILQGRVFERSGLESIVIPDKVKTVEYSVFEGCVSLKKIVIGAGVTNLGMRCFDSCQALSALILKGSVPPKLGYAAFDKISTNIYVPDDVVGTYKAASGWRDHAAWIKPVSAYENL